MFSFLRIAWHRKFLIIGIMILCGLFGYTVASLIKNPYVSQSAFIVENAHSDFYKDLTEIEKKKVANLVFYKLSPDEQARFKNNFKMDTSLTGKLYDEYVGRSVDYDHRYDPGTILALQFDITPFALAPQNIKFVFYAPSEGFAVSYSAHILAAYQDLLKDRYSFISEANTEPSADSQKEIIRIVPATREENIRSDAERALTTLFLIIGFAIGCIASTVMEKIRRAD